MQKNANFVPIKCVLFKTKRHKLLFEPMLNTFLPFLLASVVAFFAVQWVFPHVLQVARDKNLVDNPDARKLQKQPVPVLGGVAVAFGVIAGVLAGVVFSTLFGLTLYVPVFSIFASLMLMLYVGSIDDIIGLTPRTRFIIEIACVLSLIFGTGQCVDSLHGLWGIQAFSWWIAVPLTIFASVGVINAINMIDGVNGLSSSLCILSNLLFGFVFAKSGMNATGFLNFVMAASMVPFLLHNVIGLRSKMFLGDAGTMMMGVLMSYDVMSLLSANTPAAWLQYTRQGLCLVAIAVAILAVPVADTLRVMTMRMVHHQSPFSPDKTHLHHILMEYSRSHTLTTFTEVAVSLLIFILWMLSCLLGASIEVQLYVVILSAMVLVWGMYAYLTSHRTVRTGLAWRLRALFARLRQGDTEWWSRLQEHIDGPDS